jgi:hypothetical protein
MGSKLHPALSHGLQIDRMEEFSKMKRVLEISAINPASFTKREGTVRAHDYGAHFYSNR